MPQEDPLSSDEPQTINEIQVDTQNLYREEVFTDLRVASIRRLHASREIGPMASENRIKWSPRHFWQATSDQYTARY